ncbi:MAG: phosphoadenylyl-sulfate reductase [Bacteroidetes bacterium HGW-Bacteroidetes-11]|jgi:phosphoadenosine phosphosulfate reductase|nr:MAG: phosphoadenylyl-sulfate reductase [Bacteroidetes bacterium HGW-Bacteroidetes-11]
MKNKEDIDGINNLLAGKSAQEVIEWFLREFEGKVAFSTSLGAEDQAITQMIAKVDKTADIFTLDTGRLFSETYDLIDLTSKKYDLKVRVMFPDASRVEEMVNEKGINLFYDSIENRKLCCHIRKIEPLKRAFAGLDAWICGLRREQSITRKDVRLVEWDENNGLIKVNPLIEWTETELWDYIKSNQIPYNKLHDTGFPSIGCQPCTRAILPGEDVRAGRWWWENPETRECGLHKRG